ncbi:toxin VasX [Psychrobacter sp. AOP42-A1-21]|uniref:toxin VasX n=1 Tax=unclassified Psychrobacter TaxID=196806 RepID=UPI003F98DCDF
MSNGLWDSITSALGMDDKEADVSEHQESVPVERTSEGSGTDDSSLPSVELAPIIVTSCDYRCGKTEIPILPVVFSRDDYRVNDNDKRYFGDELSSESAKHDAIASLPTYTYLYCFYDYIDDYGDEVKSVREIFTGKDGALRYIKKYLKEDFEEKKEDTNKIEVTNIDETDDNTLDEMVQPATCDRDDHSTLDSKYITLGPGEIVWLMVSHAKLSKAALKKYFYDEALRDKRMQKFVADDLADNKNTKYMSEHLPEIEYINSFHQRKQLEQGGDIGDKLTIHEKYAKEIVGEDEDGEVEEIILKKDANGAINSAFQLYKNMERGINDKISDLESNINEGYEGYEDDKLEEESEKHQLKILKDTKPMMVALHDPVGDVLASAEKRNYLIKKLDDAQKNKGQMREQVNAIIIDNIRMRVEAGTGYDSSRSQSPSELAYHIDGRNKVSQANNKNIYDYIDRSRFKSVLSAAKKSKSDKRDIAKARQIFIDAIGYDKNKQDTLDFAFVMREDFPENDEESHLGYAQIMAEATQGIGIDESNMGIPDAIWLGYSPKKVNGMTAEQEFRQSLLPCISGEQPTADNWFFKALIGLDKEDLNRFENPPAYENSARLSEAAGAVAQWIEMFDKSKKKKKIAKNASISVAAKVDEINKIAANQARIIETYSNNQQYIQTEHGLLNRGEVYIRASVAKTSGWKQGFLKVLHIPFKHQVKKNITKASLNIDSKLLPAAIDKEAVLAGSSVSRRSAPFAIDFAKTFNLDATAVRTVNDATSGNKQAVLDVVTYLGDDAVNKATSLSRQLSQSGAELDSLLKTIDNDYRQLDRRSAGKSAMISAAVMAFQLRSTLINKDKISAMVARGDRASLEFMTAYTSTTLALTSASLDVANAGLQMKVARSAWVARLSLSVGVLGTVGAGFEVYSLMISLEKHKENKSGISERATNIAIGSAFTAGVSGAAIALGFAMPWVVGIMAVAWTVSYFAGWIASRYDKSNILPIHYWLDAGIFGNKNMIDVNDYPNNPFSNSAKKITPMASLEQDMHAYMLALTKVQLEPRFITSAEGFNEVLSGQLTTVISQWENHSELEVQYIGIGDQEQTLNTETVSIGTLKQQNKAKETSEGLQVTLDIPETSHFKEPAWQSIKDSSWEYHKNRENRIEVARQAARSDPDSQIEQLRVVVLYSLNPDAHPHYQLRTTVTSQ